MRFVDLPDIVLHEVLESTYTGNALEDRYHVIMALSHTSFRLRAMTLNMPGLWATIHSSIICPRVHYSKNIRRLETVLSRSREHALTVVVETVDADGRMGPRHEHIKNIIMFYLPVLRDSTTRWEALHLHVPFGGEERIMAQLRAQQFPRLEEIIHDRADIRSEGSRLLSIQRNPFLNWNFPALKRYITKRTELPECNNFPQLEELTYMYIRDQYTPTDHLAYHLLQLPEFFDLHSLDLIETPCTHRYASLSLWELENDQEDDQEDEQEENQQYDQHGNHQDIFIDIPSLCLRSLQSLRLSFMASSLAETQLWGIFKDIDLPNLRNLRIAYKNVEDTDIPVLLRTCAEGTRFNFPVLRQLAIELTRNNVHLPDFFANLPPTSTLEEFCLQSSIISPEGCEFPPGCPIQKIVLSRCNLTAADVINLMRARQEVEGLPPAPPLPTILDGDPIVFA